MNKALKITLAILLSLAGLLLALFLLARFAFREQAVRYLQDLERNHRVELLRAATPYEPGVGDFRFTYQQDTVRAREIRDYFRLDTLVRPDASTWDKTLALARFVARNIPHANQTVQPTTCNAIALWEYSRNVEPAFNCRLHAILLHELLLASGIANRFVTCLPADSLDRDCHVVNLVWLPERQQWAMIDSDQKAFVTAPDGELLSLAAMRERHIAGEPMHVVWLEEKRDADDYLSYWAKNLYWFACWEETGYDREPAPKNEGRTIYLSPRNHVPFSLREPACITTDDALFWAAPDTLPTL